jgi:hypothetical protein
MLFYINIFCIFAVKMSEYGQDNSIVQAIVIANGYRFRALPVRQSGVESMPD